VSESIDKVLSGERKWVVECGDCLVVLKTMPDGCVDSCVTDPPYGLGNREPTVDELIAYLQGSSLDVGGDFMARDWMLPTVAIWREVWRVLKPGGYLLSFAGTRTVDLIGIGIRAAGFELKDEFSWTYGQGFPHGIDVSKAIDKLKGAKRRVVGQRALTGNAAQTTKEKGGTYAAGTDARGQAPKIVDVTAPESEEAKRWDGFNTALKPCREPIIVARKPFKSTVAANILKHGTGAMNIGACRVGGEYGRPESWYRSGHSAKPDADKIAAPPGNGINAHDAGRWPGNWLLSHADGCEDGDCVPWCPIGMVDQSANEADIGRYFNTFPYEETRWPGDISTSGMDVGIVSGGNPEAGSCTHNSKAGGCGSSTMEQSQKDTRPTTRTTTTATTPLATLSASQVSGTTIITRGSEKTTNTSTGLSTENANDASSICRLRCSTEEELEPTAATASRVTLRMFVSGETIIQKTDVSITGLSAQSGLPPTSTPAGHIKNLHESRFAYDPPWFYSAKADREERERGCEHMPSGRTTDGRAKVADNPYLRDATERRNVHPTVKPISVMRWLCRLVTQPGGIVLDCFSGSGSTGVATLAEGFQFIGIELEPQYCDIARARIVGDAPLFNAGAKP